MYSRYFSKIVKTSGVPNLDADQFVRYQNIIALDYYINELEKQGLTHSLFKEINTKKSTLNRLTKELPPEELLKEMIELSR